jgi:DNA-binding transcriptional MerR regulator
MYEKEDVDLLFFLNEKKSEEKQYMTKEQKEVVRVWERFKSQGISLSDIEEAVELWKKNANKNV